MALGDTVSLTVLSFNFGIAQGMLDSDSRWPAHREKLHELFMAMETVGPDFMFCTEMGGHRAGFQRAGTDFQELLRNAYCLASGQSSGAYAAAWNLSRRNAKLTETDTVHISGANDVDMMTTIFRVRGHAAPESAEQPCAASQRAEATVAVIVGNVHIRTPNKKRPPSLDLRRRIVRSCLNHLAGLRPDGVGTDLVDVPVVRLLVGDCNLTEDHALQATQDTAPPASISSRQRETGLAFWSVEATEAGRNGDLLFVMGADFENRVLPIGASYRGSVRMRGDQHDVVAGTLRVPVATRRPTDHGASQPVAARGALEAAAPAPQVPPMPEVVPQQPTPQLAPANPEPPPVFSATATSPGPPSPAFAPSPWPHPPEGAVVPGAQDPSIPELHRAAS